MEGKRNCSQNADLPEETIRDILSRLPVKSLLRLRCVSKSWLSLISSPQFVKSHLGISGGDADFTGHRIVFASVNHCLDLKQFCVSSLMFENPIVAFNVDYPNKRRYRNVSVVGSCNGIICLEMDEADVCLWNPSTRKSKLLPRPVDVEGVVDVRSLDFLFRWWFGFSEDDYKVVVVCDAYDMDREALDMDYAITKIYSLRTNSWKCVEYFSFGRPEGDAGTFASGKLYFVATLYDEGFKNIVSLDLESEEYAIVEKPNFGDGFSDFSLGLLGGCLSLLCYNHSYDEETRADGWVLKECSGRASWSRLFSVRYIDRVFRCPHMNELVMMLNGEVLLVLGTSLVVYNPKDGRLRCHRISTCGSIRNAHVYFESLVPL